MANATIKDVAREAGVSIATVSRVLNKSSTVREDLADRVNSAIEKLGYYPNSIARTLKNDSSKTVGFVVSDIANDFFTSMVRSVEGVLNSVATTSLSAPPTAASSASWIISPCCVKSRWTALSSISAAKTTSSSPA